MKHNEYIIEQILNSRTNSKNQKEFLIRWKGFGSDQDSWVGEEDVKAQDLINDFNNKCAKANIKEGKTKIVNSLKIWSLNVQSALTWKFKEVTTELKEKNCDIGVITETGATPEHCTSQSSIKIAAENGYSIVPTLITDNKAGHVVIFIRKDIKIVSTKHHAETGRVLKVVIDIGEKFELIGVYQGHSKKDKDKSRAIVNSWFNEFSNTIIIGDFNKIGGPLDYISTRSKIRPRGELINLLEDKLCTDVMRKKYPDSNLSTSTRKHENKRGSSRLDYIFISESINDMVYDCDIDHNTIVKSDHSAVWINIIFQNERTEPESTKDKLPVRNRNDKIWKNWKDAQNKRWALYKIPEINTTKDIETAIDAWYKNIHYKKNEIFGIQAEKKSRTAVALSNNIELNALKKEERKERNNLNTNINYPTKAHEDLVKKIDTCKLKIIRETMSKIIEEKNEKIKSNPSHIFKTVKNIGKKSS